MDLQQAVLAVFAPGGALAHRLGGFQARSGQVRMAHEVATVMQQGGALVAEAGTGIGKTFAYLIPALLSGERVLVSTATKALQDQLFTRDLPSLQALLNVPARIALLKGRSSYVCLHRLGAALERAGGGSQQDYAVLRRMDTWARASHSGDMAEFGALEDGAPLYEQVTSTRENCLGARCPQLQSCHVNLARREAMAADVVVINHHLFFADLQIRVSGVAELLPTVRSVVFDEAHQLNEIGVQFLGRQLSSGQCLSLARELEQSGNRLAWAHTDWRALLPPLHHAVDAVRAIAATGSTGRAVWSTEAPNGVDAATWSRALQSLQAALQDWDRLLAQLAESANDIAALQARCAALLELLQVFQGAAPTGQVRWLEAGQSWRLVQSPLDIADAMQQRVLPSPDAANGKSWIFTSATLGNDDRLSWFVQACGLRDATVLREPSPFDYANHAGVHVPLPFADPQDGAAHSAQVAALVADAATVLGGRTLVLTTTLRAMQAIGQALQLHFADADIQVLVQGQHSKRELLERFVQPASGGCVLVGAASFWEGIDVPGEALQLVVIDKLPFPPPGDPLVEARVQDLLQRGGNGFKDYFLPQTVIALKQGAGRLLRSETDRGLLVICDARLKLKSYGRGILKALPPMRPLGSEAQFHEALRNLSDPPLTRPSTTDLP